MLLIKLLLNCNPNIIEMLGYRNYLILTDIGQKLLDNKKLFLSKKAIASFGGYANQQEHRLLNKIISGRDDLHINKQAMHLIRLYMTCIDILEKEDVIIYRSDKEREFLMSIRNGMYLNKDGTYKQEFFDVLSEYKEKFKYAKNNTSLPDCANIELINQFMIDCNRSILL